MKLLNEELVNMEEGSYTKILKQYKQRSRNLGRYLDKTTYIWFKK